MSTREACASRASRALTAVAGWLGSFPAVVLSLLVVLAWVPFGPVFHFSDAWQFALLNPISIFTFWMAFVIQHTQNIDGRAVQTKLDALLKAIEAAPNSLAGIEERPEHEIKAAQAAQRGPDGD